MSTEHPFEAFTPRATVFVSSSAVCAMPMGLDQPPVVCRRHYAGAHINFEAEDGIRNEVVGKQTTVPWFSREERDVAVETLRTYEGPYAPEDLADMIHHVATSPFYDWEQ